MKRSARTRLLSLLLVGSIGAVVAACGDDDDGGSSNTTTTTAGSGGGSSSTTSEAPKELETVTAMMFAGQAYRLPALVADQTGIFEEHGIKLETTVQPTNVGGIQGLGATSSDLGYFSIPTLTQAFQAGETAKFFCGSISVLEMTLIAKADSDLPSVIEDDADPQELFDAMKGKTIGVQTPLGGGLHLFFQSAIEAVGATDMTYVNLGVNLPVVLPAVTNNQVDLAQVSPTATQMLRDNPDVKELMYLADNVDEYKLYGSAIGGTEKFLTERPEVAKAYCEAIGEALDYILDDDNADEVNKILADDTGITVEAAELVRQESYTKYSTDLDEDLYNETVQKYVDLGVLKPDPDPGFDNTVLIPG